MNDDEIQAWVADPKRAGTLPFAAFEPRFPHKGVGAALTVRGVLYFKGGYSSEVRREIAACFDQYNEVTSGVLRWFFQEGKRAVSIAKATTLATLGARLSEDQPFTFAFTSGDSTREAGMYGFDAFCLEKWQAALGTRGLDVLSFSLPVPVAKADPDLPPRLFAEFARRLNAIHGHAGYAVNLPPTAREENESSEYFMSNRLGGGLDVGDPFATEVRSLVDNIKTVDWLTLISASMIDRVGGMSVLKSELPMDWYRLTPCSEGLLIRAGVLPAAGVNSGGDKPIAPPPAYIVLNAALRRLIPDTVSILQRGTVNGDAPVFNSKTSSNAWLRRFDVSSDELLAAKAAVLDTPRLPHTSP
ncbi:type VI immunity family protein [Burkholderia pseudomallei]|uniref:type VI immunity family protein n=1 Tax=Burkholderia pseudomallei TaxID=28450 RepID=UPI000F05EFC7|nr:type VI immunity family protein [Burkholderia pseudomallei]MBF3415614.1 DUF3396 domain-containing protein [Burkholderia pseudomallei]MBF3497978.1 DUF3396 domain-containing protein [Burkholderia pseudomallei]MBO7782576.1 DUF3396 domain-containing protein [Burkholderia pseudomallei]NVH67161.1 DUF3396 domain-containing protein [Burkholderia pseudomallei]VBQ22695.1 gp30 [Burkholderia pseudomallei]